MRYATRQDAIEQVIIPALTGYDDEFYLDAIFDEAFRYKVDSDGRGHELASTAGFEQVVDDHGFWLIVERHIKKPA